MRFVLGLLTSLLITITGFAQALPPSSDDPYLYYYSDVLNGIVIERADGSDSRLLGQGMMDEPAQTISSGGWSPSGRWLALRTWRGYAVSVNGESLTMLQSFQCVYALVWHRFEDLLFVMGQIGDDECNRGGIRGVATYWIIDATMQTLLVSASIEVYQDTGPTLHWFDDAIRFIETDWVQFYHVTMFFDGRVEIDTYSRDQYDNGLVQVEGGEIDLRATGLLDYSESRYFLPIAADGFSNDSAAQLNFEPPINSSGAGPARSVLRYDDGNWYLFGYEFCFADCAFVSRRVSVYHSQTKRYRELSACGIDAACVGWLPEQVPIDKLPDGQPDSVLPTPIYYEWTEREYAGPGIFVGVTHRLVCDTSMAFRNQVQSIQTNEIDFVLPVAEGCSEYSHDPEVVFALSPNQEYYAMTRGLSNDPYTSLYIAETGERVAKLNFEGIHLSFSDDSSLLYTRGRFADAAWRIEDLIRHAGNG